jgi:hypothetical protein
MNWKSIHVPAIAHYRQCLIDIVIICSVLVFFGPTDNWVWDPSFYYAQMRSPIIDHDVDVHAEVIPVEATQRRTVTGLVPSVWPMGVSIAWSPFFLMAHVLTLATQGQQAANGLTPLYIAFVSAGSALYGLLGVFVIYRICCLFASRGLSLLAATLVLFATPLFYYVYRQPLMGHSTGILATSLLLYVVIQIQRERIPFRYSGLVTGAFVGLNAATRWIGATTVILPATLFLFYFGTALYGRDWPRVRGIIIQCSIAAVAVFIMLLPQMALWHHLYNRWLSPPVPSQMFNTRTTFFPPYLLNLFVHTNRGVLYWAPFVVFGVVGTFRIRPISLRITMLAYLAGYCYVLGSFITWHGGGGFGARYFTEASPVLAIGFVSLFREVWSRQWGKGALYLLGSLLIAHQLLLITIVEQGWLPLQLYFSGEPLGWSYQVAGLQRILHQPSDLLLPRPGISLSHQSVLTNMWHGVREWNAYFIPLVACLIILIGMLLYRKLARLRFLPALAMLMVAYMAAWFCFLLVGMY